MSRGQVDAPLEPRLNEGVRWRKVGASPGNRERLFTARVDRLRTDG